MSLFRREKIRPSHLFIGSFAGVILLGTFLLMLPGATRHPISFVDALFTSTSATCVTGLLTLDVSSTFTLFGQLIILGLIQIGGLGIITFSTVFLMLLGRPVSMQDQFLVKDALSHSNLRVRVGALMIQVICITVLIECIGAFILAIHWWNDYPPATVMYYAAFHAVSGFCNAGISLFPDSLISFQDDWVVNGVFGILIILGGLGFLVLMEVTSLIRQRKWWRIKRMSLHSKLALTVSGGLLVLGTVLILIIEQGHVLDDMSLPKQILVSTFQSITRTAGFVTTDFSAFSNSTVFIVMLLMFVGASPGSVGGGIKTTTFGILMGLARSKIQGREEVNMFYRTIPPSSVAQSVGIFVVSIHVVMIFFIFLLITEHPPSTLIMERKIFVDVLFEAVSAFGTVGLSLGLTPDLTTVGKILILLLMFIGRVGPLTVTLAVGRKSPKGQFQYSEEGVMVG